MSRNQHSLYFVVDVIMNRSTSQCSRQQAVRQLAAVTSAKRPARITGDSWQPRWRFVDVGEDIGSGAKTTYATRRAD